MSETKLPYERYQYIRLWGKMLGSMEYYIDEQVALATEENAPRNAVYKQSEYLAEELKTESGWVTLDDITNPDAFRRMGLPVPARLHYCVTVTGGKFFANAGEAASLYAKLHGELPDGFHVSLVNNATQEVTATRAT